MVAERATVTQQNKVAKASKKQGHRERGAVNRDGVRHQVERHVRRRDGALRPSPPRGEHCAQLRNAEAVS